MVNNKQILALAASTLFTSEALALNMHRGHGHGQLHQKKDGNVVMVTNTETNVVVVTDLSYVTVYQNADGTVETVGVDVPVVATQAATTTPDNAAKAVAQTSSSSSSSTSVYVAPSPSTTSSSSVYVAPTPSTTSSSSVYVAPSPSTTSTSSSVYVAPTTSSSSSSAPATTSGSSASPTGSKRGLAYNDASLLTPFLNSGNKIGWSYNWDQLAASGAPSDLEFVSMLWGPGHYDTWDANVATAKAAGVTTFLSFNEPDNADQANMDAATCASAHQKYMNPVAGDGIRIGAPATTNSNLDGEGVQYLTSFVSACNGNCVFDFCPTHWYSPADVNSFLSHVQAVHDACGKDVWVTEFAPTGTDDEIKDFLVEVMDQIDNNSTFSFVERYSYFMAGTGSLLTSATELSSYGQAYAYQ